MKHDSLMIILFNLLDLTWRYRLSLLLVILSFFSTRLPFFTSKNTSKLFGAFQSIRLSPDLNTWTFATSFWDWAFPASNPYHPGCWLVTMRIYRLNLKVNLHFPPGGASWGGWKDLSLKESSSCISNIYTPWNEASHFAPENRPKPNRNGSYSNHPFLGAEMLVSGRVVEHSGII